MRDTGTALVSLLLPLALVACGEAAEEQPQAPEEPQMSTLKYAPTGPLGRTRVVMLGTGTPNPFPDRSGPSVAVVVDRQAYVVDFGPGVVRRAAAAFEKGVDALSPVRLNRAFATHLHSDHTAGYADLILTPWAVGRSTPLQVYGPPGLRKMTEHLVAAYDEDIQVRWKGNQPMDGAAELVVPHEVVPGPVYEDRLVKVTAFAVPHGAWEHAYGYRFDTPDRSVVISGDTAPTEAIVEHCRGCDVLVHEVYSKEAFDSRVKSWQAYHAASHTSTVQLGEIAARAKPELLVLYHQLVWSSTKERMLGEIASRYDGQVAWGDDLDVF